jgi:hypothetical protein
MANKFISDKRAEIEESKRKMAAAAAQQKNRTFTPKPNDKNRGWER